VKKRWETGAFFICELNIIHFATIALATNIKMELLFGAAELIQHHNA
jgi:hypothetical protein